MIHAESIRKFRFTSSRSIATGVVVAFVASIAFAASAADGILEINQAGAVASGGFPVTLSVSGSYKLTSNLDLTAAPGPAGRNAISVTGSDVYLDLNGFSIIGDAGCGASPPAAGAGSGIVGVARGTTVVNGTIRGFRAHGVSLGAEARVADMRVRCAGVSGIRVASDARLERNSVSVSAIGAETGANALLVDNEITGNSGYGLILGALSALRTNVIADNNGGNANAQFHAPQGVLELGTNRCGLNLSCVGGGLCGNGVLEAGESCDDVNTSSGDGCSAACQIEPGYTCTGQPSSCVVGVCGDGIVSAGEQCDGANLNGQGCQTFGFTGGSLSCSAACTLDASGCF